MSGHVFSTHSFHIFCLSTYLFFVLSCVHVSLRASSLLVALYGVFVYYRRKSINFERVYQPLNSLTSFDFSLFEFPRPSPDALCKALWLCRCFRTRRFCSVYNHWRVSVFKKIIQQKQNLSSAEFSHSSSGHCSFCFMTQFFNRVLSECCI